MHIDIIVSRHPAAIEWLRSIGVNAPIMESVTPDDIRGKIVCGNLPPALMAAATCLVAIEFTGDPPRGREYGIDEMISAGAKLTAYKAVKLDPIRTIPRCEMFQAPTGMWWELDLKQIK